MLYLRARVFYGQGDNAKTKAHCMEALRCDPDFAKARTLLKKARAIEEQKETGNAAFKSNNLQEAYDAYSSALEIDPDNDAMNSKLYSNRAAVLQKASFSVFSAYARNAELMGCNIFSLKNLRKHCRIVTKHLSWTLISLKYIVGGRRVTWSLSSMKRLYETIADSPKQMLATEVQFFRFDCN